MLAPAFRQWHIRSSDEHARRALTEGLRVHPLTAAVLVARGALSGHQASALFAGIDHVDVAGSLEINPWNGTERVQLRIKDVRPRHCGDVVSC